MKLMKFELDIVLTYAQPVSENHFQLRCIPRRDEVQQITGIHGTSDETKCVLMEHIDPEENRCLAVYLAPPHQQFSYHITGLAKLDLTKRPPAPPANACLAFTDQTALGPVLRDWRRSLPPKSGDRRRRAEQLMTLLYRKLRCVPPAQVPRSAEQAAAAREGSSADYAHCMAALCQADHIPARYVTGILPEETTLHAWVEIQDVDGIFYGYDPFYNRPVTEEYIRLSQGRDGKDCAVFVTPPQTDPQAPLPQALSVSVRSAPAEADDPVGLSPPPQVLSLARRMVSRDYSYHHIPLDRLGKVMNTMEFTVMSRVAEALPDHQPGKRLYIRDLAAYLNLPAAKLSPVIGKLEDRGLIQWTNDRDSAGSYVRLTDYGRNRLLEQQRIQYAFYERVIAQFGEEKSTQMMRLMMEFEHIMREELERYGASREQEAT